MIFSKSFGYALQGLLYIAVRNKEGTKVQLDEISAKFLFPRHFLGKVMKNLVKSGLLVSVKGPYGGFSITSKTLVTSIGQLSAITGDTSEPGECVLRFQKCSSDKPCPLHNRAERIKNEWQSLLDNTTLGDLLESDQPSFVKEYLIGNN